MPMLRICGAMHPFSLWSSWHVAYLGTRTFLVAVHSTAEHRAPHRVKKLTSRLPERHRKWKIRPAIKYTSVLISWSDAYISPFFQLVESHCAFWNHLRVLKAFLHQLPTPGTCQSNIFNSWASLRFWYQSLLNEPVYKYQSKLLMYCRNDTFIENLNLLLCLACQIHTRIDQGHWP